MYLDRYSYVVIRGKNILVKKRFNSKFEAIKFFKCYVHVYLDNIVDPKIRKKVYSCVDFKNKRFVLKDLYCYVK